MPRLGQFPLDSFRCLTCGLVFYDLFSHDRHVLIDHDIMDPRAKVNLGGRESDSEEDDPDDVRGKRTLETYLDVMYPAP
jgi:hypothetical protein